ncbi:MAG: arabinofuranosyltransferase [candidate division Zixibacteria bacterium]|nr:arabinofuranosyltransferase [candidate division Zixibacteria bacterium]
MTIQLPDTKNMIILAFLLAYFLIGVYFFTADQGNYNYDSVQKSEDLVQAKIWLLLSLLSAVLLHLSALKRRAKVWGWVLLLSVYFVVLYGLLYKGTYFGFGGQWGDNGNRLALVLKFQAFSSVFQDWYFKDLPSFYPPLWFFLSGKLAWLFNIEGYQTIRYGYFVIYALYPALLFIAWRKLVTIRVAFFITFLTIFLRDIYFDFVYYEYIAAAFFIPWWLYYIEDVKHVADKNIRWFFLGGFLGALLFMTFYYWFFIGIVSLLLRPGIYVIADRQSHWRHFGWRNMAILFGSVAVFSSIYWGPLLISMLQYGSDSMQNKWFSYGYISFANVYFSATLISLINLIGLAYLAARRRSHIASVMILLLVSVLGLFMLERVLNLMELSIQTRKLTGLIGIFLAVPSGYGLALVYGIVKRRYPFARRMIVAIGMMALLFVGNTHSEILTVTNYRWAMNDFVRDYELAVFRAVDYEGKVFLTDRYVEAVYLPYYLFVCPNGATAHPASQYNARIAMLRYLSRLHDPAQVAALLKYNRFDTVDYFFLPFTENRNAVYYNMYPLYFPGKNIELHIEFPAATTVASEYFAQRHDKGLYAVTAPDRSIRDIFHADLTIGPLQSILDEYNRVNLACDFLARPFADSLRADRERLLQNLNDSITVGKLYTFDHDIELSAIQFLPSGERGTYTMRMILKYGQRVRDTYNVFVHAVPEDKRLLEQDDQSTAFINIDMHSSQPPDSIIAGSYYLYSRTVSLQPGTYRLHMGLFSKDQGRLDRDYHTPPIEIK